MMNPVDKAAWDAGFRKSGETRTCSLANDKMFDMDLIKDERMPRGWVGLRTEQGVLCIGPKGSFFVPSMPSLRPTIRARADHPEKSPDKPISGDV